MNRNVHFSRRPFEYLINTEYKADFSIKYFGLGINLIRILELSCLSFLVNAFIQEVFRKTY